MDPATRQRSKSPFDAPKVGGDILAYCGRCKVELLHTVASMVDGQPAKVQCKSCKAEHKFRRTTGVRKKASSAPRKPKTVVRVAELWEQKMTASTRASKKYSVKSVYEKDDVIDHPKFGMGIVEEVRSSKKVLVFFRDAERLLVHGM